MKSSKFVACLSVLALASSAFADVSYSTSFESPEYVGGFAGAPLGGQNGWTVDNAHFFIDAFPFIPARTGDAKVYFTLGDDSTGVLASGESAHAASGVHLPLTSTTSYSVTASVAVELFSVNIDPPGAACGLDLGSAGIMSIDGDGRVEIVNDGVTYLSATGLVPSLTDFTVLSMTANFATGAIEYQVNGTTLTGLPSGFDQLPLRVLPLLRA